MKVGVCDEPSVCIMKRGSCRTQASAGQQAKADGSNKTISVKRFRNLRTEWCNAKDEDDGEDLGILRCGLVVIVWIEYGAQVVLLCRRLLGVGMWFFLLRDLCSLRMKADP
ncbi:hypothetical protein BELL_0095g00040 [Botrytis elliptica]|uniref:Uncharacterized protein n=1 Tax=Botrytis elliptica TaxID=278938 RepID=A0A4Z1K8H4_9HELO|nr:hypothetical protein BELL_0095g00040 [Botrytis elliptica]